MAPPVTNNVAANAPAAPGPANLVSGAAQLTMQQCLQGFAVTQPAVNAMVQLMTGNAVNPQDAMNALYNCSNSYLAFMALQNANAPKPAQPAPAATAAQPVAPATPVTK